MLASYAIAFALAQSVVVQRAAPADAVMNAEVVQRPAGTETSAFIEQLVEDARAGKWRRSEKRLPLEGDELRLIALHSSPMEGIMLLILAAEKGTGNACRIQRQRPGDPMRQRDTLVDYCLQAILGPLKPGV